MAISVGANVPAEAVNQAPRRTTPLKDPTLVRLRAATLDAKRRLAALKEKLGQDNAIVKAAKASLDQVSLNEEQGNYFVAWDCIHQFDHELLCDLDDGARHMYWLSAKEEASDKLKGWRLKASEALVKAVDDKAPAPVAAVRELHSHLWAAAQNQQHKIEVYRKQTLPFLWRLLLAVVAITLLFCWYTVTADPPSKSLLPWAESLFLGVIAGLLGGVLSTTFSLGRMDSSKKIPEARLGALMTSLRPLLGAAVSIPIVVFVQAEYVDIAGFEGPLAIFAFCFLGGFSERWFVGLMEKFEEKK